MPQCIPASAGGRITFVDFQALATSHGCAAVRLPGGTWGVVGRHLTIEFDPEDPLMRYRIEHCGSVFQAATYEDVVRAATIPPPRFRCVRRTSNTERIWHRERERPLCSWCGCRLTRDTATVDHLIANSRGGLNSDGNRVLCCAVCNQRKGSALLVAVL